MAATVQWREDNGTATGSPPRGTTRGNASNMNWKSVDDTSTAYTSATIIAGQNSYQKYNYLQFGGTFNQISAGKFAHTAGSIGTGITLVSKITSTYATPSTSAMTGSTDITSTTPINSGASVNFATSGPESASPSATLGASGYSQYIVTQLQTQVSAAAGDIGSQTLTFQWNEN